MIHNSAARHVVFDQLEDLAAWTKDNLPPVEAVRITGLPEFPARTSSSTEDFTVMLTLLSEQ